MKSGRVIRKIKNIINSHTWLKIRNMTSVQENKLFFESFSGNSFQGNVYYIFKAIFHDKRFSEYHFIIASKNPDELRSWLENKNLFDKRVTIVEYLSESYIILLYSAKYLVNNVSFPMAFVKKDEQFYVNTWHGTPLKCIGVRTGQNPLIVQNMQRDFLCCDYLLSPNPATTEVLLRDFNLFAYTPADIQSTGYPRNEIFFDDKFRKNERKKLGIESKQVIFYMPTWRDKGNEHINFSAEMEKLSNKLGDGYIIFLKLHPLDQSEKSMNSAVRYMPSEYEVYEFLQCCDVLITDYSSVFFDFANTGRKIVLYQFDKDDYYRDRGVYDNIAREISFPVATSISQLAERIQEPTEEYLRFKNTFCPWDGNNPTKNVVDAILEGKSMRFRECRIVVIDSNDELNAISKHDQLVYLIPGKKNGFFQKQESLLKVPFLVGSLHGEYLLSERLSMVFSFCRITKRICREAFDRERKRYFGNLLPIDVSSDCKIPEFLKTK